jgi:hypothetical protein
MTLLHFDSVATFIFIKMLPVKTQAPANVTGALHRPMTFSGGYWKKIFASLTRLRSVHRDEHP